MRNSTERVGMRRVSLGPICVLVAGWLLAQPAGAADLYLSGSLSGSMPGSGTTGTASGKTDFFKVSGEDTDSSPAYGGTLGIAFAMDEVLPNIKQFEVPSWVVRAEIEGLAGRSYEFRTDGANSDDFFTQVDNQFTVMPTTYLEVPVRAPIQWLFGRIPMLEPMSIYGGAGVGVARIHMNATDNVSEGSATVTNFAWQAGAGITYQLTDITTFQFGYRYLSLGKVGADLKFAPGAKAGGYDIDLAGHELVAGLRVNFYTAPLKDMNPKYWRMPKVTMPGWMPSWLGGPSDEPEPEPEDADDL
jgi:opacity protein-like surface antigen